MLTRNKKDLLRERKRHTARCAASARYAGERGGPHPVMVGRGTPVMVGGYPIQSWWGVPHPVMVGRYPIQSWWGGTPHHPDLARGYPRYLPDLGTGTPCPDLGWGIACPDLGLGTPAPPPSRPGMGYPPRPEMGYSSRPEMGYSPPDLGWGYPPPH